MNLEEITAYLGDYFEPYMVDYLSNGRNKQKSDGNYYNTFVADIKEDYLDLCPDSPTVIIKEIGERESKIYSQLVNEYNPYLETIFGVTKLGDRFVSFNEFIKTPEVLNHWHKTSINLEDYVSGSIANVFPRLTEKEALVFLYQMCEGLSTLHDMGIFHGDITPRNILLADRVVPDFTFNKIEGIHRNVSIKIIDFDVSKKNKKEYEPVTSIMGTDLYVAPEILDFSKPRDMRVDIYSLGCLLGFMLTGDSPKEKDISGKISKKCWRLIKKCTESYDFRIKNVKTLKREILKILRLSDNIFINFLYHIPGYRSCNIIKSTVATVIYFFCGIITFSMWEYSKRNSLLFLFSFFFFVDYYDYVRLVWCYSKVGKKIYFIKDA